MTQQQMSCVIHWCKKGKAMSLIKLPEIRASRKINGLKCEARPDALERWEPSIQAARNNDATISIYDHIGESWDGSGIISSRIAAALRAIGDRDVVVNINSPGGDFFEGVAIYNMLREHPHKVTVQVMGLAASAASVIAMAGDEILVGDGSFLMIHNAWVLAIGNRHDMVEAAELLEPFDMAMADVYSARTGQDKNDIIRMMDKETWINASKAVEEGFATGYLDSNLIADDVSAEANVKYLAVVETAMAKAGHTRSERREILKGLFSSKLGAAEDDAMPRASDSSELVELVDLIRGLS